MTKILWGVIIVLTFAFPVAAQQNDTTSVPPPPGWFLEDPEKDHFEGVSVTQAYALLEGQPSKTVIVAVVDTGVDTEHEDLKSVIWTNPGEIPGNGIDDDHNGYIDDVHGWNFLGGKNGNVEFVTYELTRQYMMLKKKFENVTDSTVQKKDKKEYARYQKIATKFIKLRDKNAEEYKLYAKLYENVVFAVDTLRKVMKVDSITRENLSAFNPSESILVAAKSFMTSVFQNAGEIPLDEFQKQLKEGVDYYGVIVNYGYNESYDSRQIIGDHYSDTYEKNYGNNDVKGPDALHGTHVAGIIAADRKNDTGIRGIADNVRIMVVRALPNGDERDKDVANAIRYAVDNGAKIINMSFGKGYSPEKEAVDKAVHYAEQKGVLLVHAAGNDGDDNDTEPNFPSRYYQNGKEARNWMEIGASSPGNDRHLIADFSNYGKKTVDVLAPGVDIYSTAPENKYVNESGTSMASPVTAGVAALLMSYFPELTAHEVREILLKSSRKFDNLKVELPKKKNMVEFSQLSISGGVVNAAEAVKLARQTTGRRRAK